MNEERFKADIALLLSQLYRTPPPSDKFKLVAGKILLEALRNDHPEAMTLLKEYEEWKNRRDEGISKDKLLEDLVRTIKDADVCLIQRRFERSWIYEVRYQYWKSRGLIFAEAGMAHREHMINWNRMPNPPRDRESRVFFLDNLVLNPSLKSFDLVESPNGEWWDKNVSEHMHREAIIQTTNGGYIFPIKQALVEEACVRCASTEEYTILDTADHD